MYSNNLCVLFFLLSLSLSGQMTEIAIQGFETSGGSWKISEFSTPPCTLGDDSWNYHSQLGEISAYSADSFWGITDLNGSCGSSGFESIELETVNISGYRNVELSFFVNVQGFDNGDDMKYQIWLDQTEQPEHIFIDGADNYSTSGWQEIKILIPNTVSEIKIAVSIRQNGPDYAGLDNFKLQGVPVHPCNDIFISEYIEGTSSSAHRNNYIELYNPTSDSIDLTQYSLAKYVGKSQDISSRLLLSGNISPHATFLIEDIKEELNVDANLSTNSATMDFNGDDKIALLKNENIIDLIGVIGDSVFFARDLTLQRKSEIQNPNNQYQVEEWESYALENIKNLNQHTSSCQGPIPEIEVFSNYQPIQDGDKQTSILNNTYMGALPQGQNTSITKTYTVKNTGNADLEIINISSSGEHGKFFHIDYKPGMVSPGDSLHFNVSFSTTELGIKSAIIQLTNNDSSENQFSYKIQGEITGRSNSPLIISQYYEGIANDKWLEITNTGSITSPENSYYICILRNEAVNSPIGNKPSAKKEIPSLAPGESILFRASLDVNQPEYAISQNSIKTSVCSFSGDDILFISTSGEESCWENKTDLIGKIGNWGSDLSLVRKTGCQATGSNTGFDPLDWNLYTNESVDLAKSGSSKRLGEHYLGATAWSNNTWQNGLPSLERNVEILENYSTELYGEVAACNLEIYSGAHFTVEPGYHTAVKNDLIVKGLLEIDDQASLIMIDNQGEISVTGQFRVNKIARNLKAYDYVYWSSPVKNAMLESVFDQSPQNSFHTFLTTNFSDDDSDGRDDDENAWQREFGAMNVARGYTVMAPMNSQMTDYKVEFKGAPNTGIIRIPLELQNQNFNSDNDWNLIGNPYPSSIDANSLIMHPDNKGMMKGTVYFWSHNTPPENHHGQGIYSSNDYAMYTIGTGGIRAQSGGKTPTQYISSCQGFFIEAEQSGYLTFLNEMRRHQPTDHFFKTDKTKQVDHQDKIWLNLYNDQGVFSQVLIGFIEGASEGIDPLFDGKRLSANASVSFYSQVEKVKLAIQGKPTFTGTESTVLGFDNLIDNATKLRIEIDFISSSLKDKAEGVYLFDKKTKQHHDLLQSHYEFTVSEKGNQTDRFILYFSNPDTNLLSLGNPANEIHWYTQNNTLYIKSLNEDKIKDVQMFDLTGRRVRNIEVNDYNTHLFWAGLATRAIYILRVNLQNKNTVTKRIIHL